MLPSNLKNVEAKAPKQFVTVSDSPAAGLPLRNESENNINQLFEQMDCNLWDLVQGRIFLLGSSALQNGGRAELSFSAKQRPQIVLTS